MRASSKLNRHPIAAEHHHNTAAVKERVHSLVDRVEFFRADATRRLDPERRVELGQFLTPPHVARTMARLFSGGRQDYHLVDAGAGVGSLSAAFIEELCTRAQVPNSIHITAFDFVKLIVNPRNVGQMFLATSKGVYRTDTAGFHWYLYSEGLRLNEEVDDIVINVHGLDRPILYIGTRRGFWQRAVDSDASGVGVAGASRARAVAPSCFPRLEASNALDPLVPARTRATVRPAVSLFAPDLCFNAVSAEVFDANSARPNSTRHRKCGRRRRRAPCRLRRKSSPVTTCW